MYGSVVKSFVYKSPKEFQVLDQTLLPNEVKYIDVVDTQDGFSVIKDMKVRGAPCIAAVGCLSLISELNQPSYAELCIDEFVKNIKVKSEYLISSRPTAVNLRKALGEILRYANEISSQSKNAADMIKTLTAYCNKAVEVGELLNKRLGDLGAFELQSLSKERNKLCVLTHCNTGTLATVGYGTALGVIRSLHKLGILQNAYCTETRPYNQGARLTAWELVCENIPATLIADNMVAFLMATKKIDAVVVGADCVAANGDTANKIGTLQIAIIAKHYSVPFYVAAPFQTIDLSTSNGDKIKIELRPAHELKRIANVALAPDEVDAWNPCFDVTPSNLISGIMTEYGVCKTEEITNFVQENIVRGQNSEEFSQAIF